MTSHENQEFVATYLCFDENRQPRSQGENGGRGWKIGQPAPGQPDCKLGRWILSNSYLIYSSLFFTLSLPTGILPRKFRPPLTDNTHYRRWREPRGLDSPK